MVTLALGTTAGVGDPRGDAPAVDPHGDAPAVDRVRISPTGDHVLAIASGGGRRGLAVIDRGTLHQRLQGGAHIPAAVRRERPMCTRGK